MVRNEGADRVCRTWAPGPTDPLNAPKPVRNNDRRCSRPRTCAIGVAAAGRIVDVDVDFAQQQLSAARIGGVRRYAIVQHRGGVRIFAALIASKAAGIDGSADRVTRRSQTGAGGSNCCAHIADSWRIKELLGIDAYLAVLW